MNKYLIALCVIFATYGVIITSKWNSEHQSKSAIEDNIKATRDSLKDFVTKDGIHGAVIRAQEGTIQELKATAGAEIKDREDKLGLKDKQIEGLQNVVVKLHVSFDDYVNTTRHHDTVATVDHKSEYNVFHQVITEDSAGKQTSHVDDTTIVPLHITEYTQKKNIFSDKVHTVSAYSDNCEAKITGLESVLVIKEKPRIWGNAKALGIGIAAGFVIHLFIK